MIEYDTDAYRRKWVNTIGMAKVNGELQAVHYTDIGSKDHPDGSTYTVCLPHFDQKNYWGVHKKAPDDAGLIEPVYFPFESGIYLHKKIKGFLRLEKAHRKGFCVGLVNGGNIFAYGYHEDGSPSLRFSLVDTFFLSPLPKTPVKETGAGYLDKRWWYNNTGLYYMSAQLGFKDKKRFLVSRQEYIPFLTPLLDRECQIKVL